MVDGPGCIVDRKETTLTVLSSFLFLAHTPPSTSNLHPLAATARCMSTLSRCGGCLYTTTPVANSPKTSSYQPLPSPLFTSNILTTPTSSSSSAFPFPPVPSPELTRPSPPQKRPSSLSMLLNGPDEPPAKNQRLASLMSPATSESPLPFSNQDRRPSSASSTGSQQPHPLRTGSFPGDTDAEPLTNSPSPTNSLSPSRPQFPRLHHAPPTSTPVAKQPLPFTKPKLPYNPRRITPAASILRPLTEAEVATWVSLNPLRNINRPGGALKEKSSPLGKRGRENEERTEGEPVAKRSKDVGLVVQHCEFSTTLYPTFYLADTSFRSALVFYALVASHFNSMCFLLTKSTPPCRQRSP